MSILRFLYLSILLLILNTSLAAPALFAQSDSAHVWDHNVIASLNLSQVGFTHWAPGGTNALSYAASVNGKSVRDVPVTNWSTTYKFTYGQAKLGDAGIRKTDDEINLESVLTYKLGVHVNPYGAVSLLTQFGPGYKYSDTTAPVQISNFFDPGYLKESAGIGLMLSKIFQTRLGLALRETFTNHYNAYSDDPNTPEIETHRTEGGVESVSELELPIDSNILVRSKVELFAPIKTLDRIVNHSQITLAGRISKLLTAEFTALVVNDPVISPYTQLKQGIALGIVYTIL